MKTLPPRCVDVVRLASEGKTAPQTARALGIALGTCKHHRAEVLHKLGAVSMPHAVALTITAGVIPGVYPEDLAD